ncbi:MAG: type II toxin-antitoxin system HicA family toxin [Peptococcaceae bacterium]|nr:type II toxin-antitoxin system HicA family toxin [Peptococcaceae bacterium]
MTAGELIRYLKKRGIEFKYHGAKHDAYWNPGTGSIAQIPRHPSQELKKGTQEKILRDLGLK